ncbi:MAG: MOSC domain-containing protein, partial [Candidatus Schekmanbacteria bacterium]|nr:MOSC domain-containing protein [Candidatus Schekmanbacteria bacterium]
MQGKVIAVSLSAKKGQPKENQAQIKLIAQYGVENDAHAGDPLRQVSLLAMESIQKILDLGLEVSPGGFAENITTAGLNIWELKVGDTLQIGAGVILRISQLGKVCHNRC